MDPTAARLLFAAAAAVSLLASPVSASAADEAFASAQDAATRCAATIVSISPCLPHVAAVAPPLAGSPPTPTEACCVPFLRAVSPSVDGGGGEGCLCHLLRNPLLLGFPIDAARLAALVPACAAGNAFAAATVEAATLFADACLELKALPELHVTPQSTTTAEMSPAALSESVSKPMETVPPAGSLVRSATAATGSGGIPVAVWILAAAAAVAVIT
ncbi:hypothetical protein BS78_K085800 [Paspalum vaginatum]|uniref:Bifunctional inhibitor/plant lipid transfer protein/seed storage helical domain-containing protein n=1 Tax=Paspalum vaginatum TaxID=158149 RepID=A0A9W7XE96_9POAL|nr:hypothetical protein BS78_K085800 [Paspalum vaginatum]